MVTDGEGTNYDTAHVASIDAAYVDTMTKLFPGKDMNDVYGDLAVLVGHASNLVAEFAMLLLEESGFNTETRPPSPLPEA